jgi:hypothetical protein
MPHQPPAPNRQTSVIAGLLLTVGLCWPVSANADAAGGRLFVANSSLEVLYIRIDAGGGGELGQAFVSPGSPSVRILKWSLSKVRDEGGAQIFRASQHETNCGTLRLEPVKSAEIIIATLGGMRQPFSDTSEQTLQAALDALHHVADSQRGFSSKGGVIKPSGFPPSCT